jgi:hypothetical protein
MLLFILAVVLRLLLLVNAVRTDGGSTNVELRAVVVDKVVLDPGVVFSSRLKLLVSVDKVFSSVEEADSVLYSRSAVVVKLLLLVRAVRMAGGSTNVERCVVVVDSAVLVPGVVLSSGLRVLVEVEYSVAGVEEIDSIPCSRSGVSSTALVVLDSTDSDLGVVIVFVVKLD